MNQMKVIKTYKYLMILGFSFMTFACTPKKQGVRAQVKTGQASLNPSNSAIADQQATAMNAIYKINSVSLPTATDTGVVVNSDLLTPNNEYLPISTSFENGVLDSQGIFNDTARGLQVYVNARCSDVDCEKYLLLITVVRNNQAVYQSGAISFKEDCKYYSASMTSATGMFQSIDDFNSKYSYLQPMGDGETCLQ